MCVVCIGYMQIVCHFITFLDFGTYKMERLGVFSTHLRDTVSIYVFKWEHDECLKIYGVPSFYLTRWSKLITNISGSFSIKVEESQCFPRRILNKWYHACCSYIELLDIGVLNLKSRNYKKIIVSVFSFLCIAQNTLECQHEMKDSKGCFAV